MGNLNLTLAPDPDEVGHPDLGRGLSLPVVAPENRVCWGRGGT